MIQGVVQEVFENFFSLSIEMPLLVAPKKKPHVYFALDVSGSMSGSNIDLAKKSVAMLIDKLEAENISFTLIAFSDAVSLQDTRKIGYAGMRDFAMSLGPQGGTRFLNVFVSLKSEIMANNDSSSAILFLTDGCDNDGMPVLGPCMEGFQKWVNDQKLLTAIHAIGLGSDHDANLLTNIIKFGTHEGTFQYVQDSDEMVPAVERLQKLLDVAGGWGTIKVGTTKTYKVSLPLDKKDNTLRGVVFVLGEDLKETLAAEIWTEGEKKEYMVNVVKSADEVTPKLFNAFAREQLRTVIDAMRKGGISQEQRTGFLKIIAAINTKAATMVQALEKHSDETKRALLPLCSSVALLAGELMPIVMTHLEGALGNDRVAHLYDLVFRGVLGGGIRRKVERMLVKGEAFLKACKAIDKFGIAVIPENERDLTVAQFEVRVGPKPQQPGLGFSVGVYGPGKELPTLQAEFGAPLGIDPRVPYMVIAFNKKTAKSIKADVEELINVAWSIGSGFSPNAAALDAMIERKFGESDKKVYMLIAPAPATNENLKPVIEKLSKQPALAILEQKFEMYLHAATDLGQIATADRPFYQLLLDGGCFGVNSSLLSKLADIPKKIASRFAPHMASMIPMIQQFLVVKSLVGEMVFEVTPEIRAHIDATISEDNPLRSPVKDSKAMFAPLIMGQVQGVPLLGKLFELAKSELQGIELYFYGAGLFGGNLKIPLPGLDKLLTFE